MGFLRDQASRLIRTKWAGNTDLLAEEIYAIFTGDVPIVFDSPVTIVNNTNDPPLTIRDFGDSDQSIRITKQRQPPPDLPEIPPLDFDGVGGITITNIYPDGGTETWGGDAGNPPDTRPGTGDQDQSGGGGGFPGKVVSGTGSTYLVDVYEAGLSAAPTQRTVTQLSIASGETIPADTWAIVGKVGSDYFLQVPVWLQDLS